MTVVVALLPDRRISARADATAAAGCHVGTRSAVAIEVVSAGGKRELMCDTEYFDW